MTVSARGGKGSNQYQSKGVGVGGQAPRSSTAATATAVDDDPEMVAAAFMDTATLYEAAEASTNPAELDAMARVIIHRKDTDTANAVMGNPHTSSATLEVIINEIGWTDDGLRASYAVHPNADEAWLCETMFEVNEDYNGRQFWEQSFMQALADRPGIGSHIASWVADDSDKAVRQRLARNADCPPEILTVLAGDDERLISGTVVGNPTAPPEALIIASKRVPTSSSWRTVLERDDCPSDLLTELAYHGEPDIRIAAIGHVNMPAEAVAALRSDSSPQVRRAAWKAQASAG